jgi:hypothetical protein
MTANSNHHNQNGSTGSRSKWVLIGFLAIAGFFLYTEHRAHLFGMLPFLLLLACPLMHFFHGHGNHGGHEGHGDGDAHKHHEGQSSQGDKK